jgi:peptidoglycan/LPS O-acetylase OafA/YrhL
MRLNNLQALRGIACLVVVLFHVAERERTAVGPDRAVLLPLVHLGYGAVDLLFVLSGFVITWVNEPRLGRPSRLGDYLGRRLWRVYPVYWACWLLAWPLTRAAPTEHWAADVSAGTVARVLLLVPPATTFNVMPPAWTLFFEVTFYVAFAGFFLLPRRLFLPALAAWATAILAGWRLLPWTDLAGAFPAAAMLLHPFVAQFLIGCVLGHIVRRGWIGRGRTCLVTGLAAWYLVGKVMQHNPSFSTDLLNRVVLIGGVAALILYGAVAVELQGRWRLPRWLQRVGDASYPIYLIHYPLLDFTGRLLGRPTGAASHWLWLGTMVGVGLAAGLAIHYAIEAPLMNLVRRRPAHSTANAALSRAA